MAHAAVALVGAVAGELSVARPATQLEVDAAVGEQRDERPAGEHQYVGVALPKSGGDGFEDARLVVGEAITLAGQFGQVAVGDGPLWQGQRERPEFLGRKRRGVRLQAVAELRGEVDVEQPEPAGRPRVGFVDRPNLAGQCRDFGGTGHVDPENRLEPGSPE